MINLFLTLIIIFAFICVLTVVIGIKNHKTFYPMVSVICGVLIIAFAFCCAIETESSAEKNTDYSKAYISVAEHESEDAETESMKKSEAKEHVAETEKETEPEIEDDASQEELPVKKFVPEEDTPDDMRRTVYITKTGTKYHYSYFCSSTDFYECTLEQAIERRLEPCKKCVK